MPRDPWTFLESGATGWNEITSPRIPNPNTTPISSPTKSTQKRFDLEDGSRAFITPETKYTREPVEFAWLFQSGPLLYNKFDQVCRDNLYFKIQGHMPDREWTGKIIQVDEKLLPRQRTDYRDITITLEQQDD